VICYFADGSDALKTEILNEALKNIDKPQKREQYYFFSLEYHMERLLLEHGEPCDYAKDSSFDQLMKTYNERDYPQFYDRYDNDYDSFRRKFQRKVLDSGLHICNHFKFFRCTVSGTCGCKDNLGFNSKTKLCTTKRHTPYYYNLMKLFTYEQYEFAVSISGHAFYEISTFRFVPLDCESGTRAVKPGSWLEAVCLHDDDLAAIGNLQLDFEKKVSIEAGGVCNSADHVNLFNLASTTAFQTFPESQKALQDLVNNPSVKYCKIRQRATCSMDGKCTCVPPTVIENGGCTLPLDHKNCESTGITLDPHDEHKKALDELILPHESNRELHKFLCPFASVCHKAKYGPYQNEYKK